MSLKKPENENYCGEIVEIKTLIPLENCDNVVGAIIYGNQVIVGKDTQIGQIGVFFPVECQLSEQFLSQNNLYRKAELNVDKTKKGYFDESGRIRCIKFRNQKSMGIFLPIESLSFTKYCFNIGDSFDEVSGIKICKKYVIRVQYSRSEKNNLKKGFKKKVSRLLENQFHYHIDTMQLAKNLWKIKPKDIISITSKWHGSSLIVGNILCKKKLSIPEKILKFLKVNIVDTEYATIVSSRKVVKNDDLNKVHQHFYKEDIWTLAADKIKDTLKQGMTYYAEIVGHLPSGGMIQKSFDYGNEPNNFSVHIYRITSVNAQGDVFEWSAKQVQDWCREKGLNAVKQFYYGYAKDMYDIPITDIDSEEGLKVWQETFINKLKETYLEKECEYCLNKVPSEGIVLRREVNDIDVYKLKSFKFLEFETKELDTGTVDIESAEPEDNIETEGVTNAN
jgi:hypothetical protein